MYSDLYLKKRHNYSVLYAIILAVGLFGVALYLTTRSGLPLATASKKTVVRNEVVNVSSKQIGIFWQTDSVDEGWIVYGQDMNNLDQTANDEQDVGNKKGKHKVHYSVLKNLRPDTNYYYKIVSNRQVLSREGEAFSARTSKNYTVGSTSKPAYGKVLLPSGEPAVGAFVLLSYKNSYPFLAMTKSTGEWLIPMQYGVDKKTHDILTISDAEISTIDVLHSDLSSRIKVSLKNVSPLPKTVVLGQSYEFVKDEDVLPAATKRNLDKKYEVDLLFPKDGAVIPGSQPLIRGKGVPGAEVIVNINTSPPFSTRTIINEDGSWRVSVPSSVRPGIYQLTVTTEDVQGMKIGFRRRFVMAKSGEAVLAEATGSGTTTGTPTVSPTPTTTSITQSPTIESPTPQITNTYYDPTATPVPPTSGVNGSLPYVFGGVTMVILGVGLVLLF